MNRHVTTLIAAILTLGVLVGTTPPVARADGPYIYWLQSNGNTTLGRMNLDGSDKTTAFVDLNDDAVPWSVVTDGTYLYWTNFYFASDSIGIGRVDLAGTNLNEHYVTLSGGQPRDLVIRGDYLYWTIRGGAQPAIGRVKTDGTDLDESYIELGAEAEPNALVIKGPYIYWTDDGTANIGRVKLNGSNKNEKFVKNISVGEEVMNLVDLITVGNYLYWSNADANIIGRVKLNGKAKDTSVIDLGPTGMVYSLARQGNNLYWLDFDALSIGRSKLNGKNRNNSYIDITSGSLPSGLLIAP
ncbi:MAG: hypothetical protein RIQ87_408 [Chloroflexota bacterium]|jgi:hypothetical protein